LIHFRKATHGKVDKANCHPFLFCEGKYALIHNGVLNIKCTIEGMSDTANFVKLVLEPIMTRYNIPINDGCLNYLISTSIGTDKMAIMTETGETYVINPEKGEWENDVWYSNTSYRWSYTSTTSTTRNNWSAASNSSSYPPAQTYKKIDGWKKHFQQDDSEDDKSYLEFWKMALNESKEDVNTSNSKTQKPKLLENGTSESSHNVAVEEVENMTDEEIQALIDKKEKKTEIGPGYMMEYGWWDEQIESDIDFYMGQLGLNRESAMLKAFNKN
jgi:hypothetical protein